MFPEAFLIHEAHIKDGRLLRYYSHDIVEKIGKDGAALVATNQRYVLIREAGILGHVQW